MAEKLDTKEMVSFEELLMGEVITNQAIINLLIQKGIVTQDEVLTEIEQIRKVWE